MLGQWLILGERRWLNLSERYSIEAESEFYFVHSYFAVPANHDDTHCTAEYAGRTFCSTVARGNIFATQFHPEKSGEVGLRLLENFIRG